MSLSQLNESRGPVAAGCFNTTHWSEVLLAGRTDLPQAEVALENLCRTYWYPLYAYVRRQGHSAHDAQDLTQEFFARLLEKKYLRFVTQERGRFRSFLLKSLHHFLINEWARGQAQKRGGGRKILSLDEVEAERLYLREPAGQVVPENLYDKNWAVALLERAMERLRADYAAAGKGELFDHLQGVLLIESSIESYAPIAVSLGMNPGAVKVAVHRLRQRFRDVVRAEVGRTVAKQSEVDEELRCLIASLSH
jgi:RNA polymerase sigma factor (sigma-70 family)